MKRWALRIVVFLLLGAIVNVAVAWGLAVWSPLGHVGSRSPIHEPLPLLSGWLTELDPEIVPAATIVQFDFRGRGREGLGIATHDDVADRVWILARSGWPSRSMMHVTEHHVTDASTVAHWGIAVRTGARLSDNCSHIPLRPLWPGFAINTVFYAVVLWLLFAGPFVVRRWRRIRRGLCPKCAYDLRGTPQGAPCPECGKAVAS